MDNQDYNKTIEELLSKDTREELEVKDNITNYLLSPECSNAGCNIAFVGSYKRHSEVDTWNEYRVLYKVVKYRDTAEYLTIALDFIKDSMSKLRNIECESVGIQEVYCIDPFNYYILVYIIK